MIDARHPRREASAFVPPDHEARVLEPSPPANQDPAWFADDPTDPGEASAVVTPVPGEGTSWGELAEADGEAAAHARDHWLDGRRPLEGLPDGYDLTRRSLHQLAFFAVAPKRHAATGKLGLRHTHRGFGTPFFVGPSGDDEQVRVEGGVLVHQVGDHVRSADITTLIDATGFLGLEYREQWFDAFHDPLSPLGSSTRLEVDAAAADAIGAWFGFATHVLERFRRSGAADISRVQLWPEHFDPAMEAGSNDLGQRASYGASPGDDAHPEPYLYISAWGEVDRSDTFWNGATFNGAILGHAQLQDSADPYATALEFYEAGLERLTR